MAIIYINIPDDISDWVEAQVRAGRYRTASEYVRDLIQRDQNRKAEFQALVTEGIESGVSARTRDDINQLSRRTADDQRKP